MAYKKPKGTVDFFPEEMRKRNYVFSRLSEVSERFGYRQVDFPSMETLKLLTSKGGEQIKPQIFILEKRGEESLGLIFEGTVSGARMFMDVQKNVPKPVKWYYLLKMWRYERPQAGRLREFFQWGIELFGSDRPEADAEVINLAIEGLKSLGLTEKDFVVYINNRKLLQGLLEGKIGKAKMDDVLRIIDRSDKATSAEFKNELNDIGADAGKIVKTLGTPISKIKVEGEAKSGLESIKQILKLVDRKYVKFNLCTARGLAYYTDTVFEIFDKKGELRAIAGGGRYDSMIQQLGGQAAPATGFAMGFSTLSLLLEERGLMPAGEGKIDYYVMPVTEKQIPDAFEIAAKLREKSSVDIDLMGRKVRKQFEYASEVANTAVIVGQDELKKKSVKLRNLKTGREKLVKIKDL